MPKLSIAERSAFTVGIHDLLAVLYTSSCVLIATSARFSVRSLRVACAIHSSRVHCFCAFVAMLMHARYSDSMILVVIVFAFGLFR